MDFQIERDGTDLTMTYLDFGEWYPVPKKYKLGAAVTELLKLVKHKTRNKYELDVICEGIVSIDKECELVLIPPGLDDEDVDAPRGASPKTAKKSASSPDTASIMKMVRRGKRPD